ncbi:MAG: 3-isopropylmalate dehydratase small subunit [Desulfovibrio sp.]|jgi:3-isopropylmalate/(R)-2-methylmalate dehydratase small subunit|nr:3-isopropylmalate dehydratase small subunit [Desulfovibrio sp.]
MQNMRKGDAYIFGDNINTDIISPPQYMELSAAEAAKYAMSAIDTEFASTVKPGDIIVAGNNFGSGSSRELAPLSLRHLQIGAMVAKTFARIFYRNAINLGLAVVECADTDKIKQGDAINIDFAAGTLYNETRNETYPCSKLPSHILALVQEGGLIEHLKKQRGKNNLPSPEARD